MEEDDLELEFEEEEVIEEPLDEELAVPPPKFARQSIGSEEDDLPSFLEHYAPPSIDIDHVRDLDLFVVDIECQKRKLPDDRYDDQEVVQERYKIETTPYKRGRNRQPTVPCIRIYCKTRSGSSVCLNVYGYYPVVHLLTSCPLTPSIVEEIREEVFIYFRNFFKNYIG